MKECIAFLLFVCTTASFAQDSVQTVSPVAVSSYAEVYYLHDFGKPAYHTRPPFLYSHNRTNEVALNLGYLKAAYNTETARANLALMTGTYANANLASEPGVLKNIYEANVGLKLSKKKNIWLDAGILPSHICFESAVGKDCWTLTRSILAENSPYYEAGLRTSYKTANDKWYAAVFLLNGWQRMERLDGNNTPAFGSQLTFTPSKQLLVNSSTYIGNEHADTARKWRYFHNFYAIWQVAKHWGLTAGFDVGIEQQYKGSGRMNVWYAPVLLLRYAHGMTWFCAARWEYYKDKFGVIVPNVVGYPFQAHGASLNVDYTVAHNLLWRVEGRMLWNGEPVFQIDSSFRKSNVTMGTGLCFSFP